MIGGTCRVVCRGQGSREAVQGKCSVGRETLDHFADYGVVLDNVGAVVVCFFNSLISLGVHNHDPPFEFPPKLHLHPYNHCLEQINKASQQENKEECEGHVVVAVVFGHEVRNGEHGEEADGEERHQNQNF